MREYSFLKSYISGETAFGYAGIVGKAIGILNSFIILFSLTLYQFGVYQLLLASIGLVSIFLFPGFNNVVLNDLIRFENEGKKRRAKQLFSEYAVFRVVNGLVLSVIVFAGSFVVSRLYSGDMGLYVQILSAILLIDSIFSVIRVFLRARLHFGLLALEQIGRELIKLGFLASFLVFAHLDIKALIITYVSAPAITLIVLFFITQSSMRSMLVRFSQTSVLWWVVRAHGKWALAHGYIKEIGERIRPWLIKIFISTEAVSLFSVAVSLVDLLQSFFPANVLGSLIPRELKDTRRLRFIVMRGIKYLTAIGLVFAIIGSIVLPPLVFLILPKYEPSLAFFIPLTLILPLYGMSKLTGVLLTSYRKQRSLALRPIVSIFIMLSLSPFFYSLYGLWGAVLVFLIDYVVATALFWILVFRYFPDLKFPIHKLFVFTRDDQDFFKRVLQETFRLIRAKLRIGPQKTKM